MTQLASRALFPRRWVRIVAASILLPLIVTGCSTPKRLPAVPLVSTTQAQVDQGLGQSHIRFMVARESEPFAEEARSSMQKEKAWLASKGHVGPLPPANFLAISGGGDNGAFGSGLLNGWTAAGTRPEFKAVTGVSTGALTAPFAFLGPKYDESLKEVFTTVSKKDIFKSRGIRGIFSDGMADTTPLAKLIARYIDRPMLDAIAAEYAKGRLLLVGTADLDALEPVVWNMTAIAASKDPRALDLFRSVLRASASIPGAFPPVMFDVEVNGVRHQEMHGDGGTIAQVFLYPPSLNVAELSSAADVQRKRNLYIIRNAKFAPEWADVPRKTIGISARAIGSLTRTQGIGDLYIIYALAQRDGFDFNLTFIPPTFDAPHPEEFDTNYMQQLYATGYRMAAGGVDWQKFPPGYVAPKSAAK
jgi:predicted acylesterase/phospholipase RssA